MAETLENRVAVYIDFDNIVISRYDQVHDRNSFAKDRPAMRSGVRAADSAEFVRKATEATVDMDAILDYASSFGTIAISRAYADWSATINSRYSKQLIDRAIDLTQLFPVTAGMKNGADIRLAVDVVEDLFQRPEITHVVIVAGDSDYIALAQRIRRLGRYVVGIGVAGATSHALTAACDQFRSYEDLPRVEEIADIGEVSSDVAAAPEVPVQATATSSRHAATPKATAPEAAAESSTPDETLAISPSSASKLLVRALVQGDNSDSADEAGWLPTAAVKNQMKRMDSRFNERSLGYKNFTEFVKARGNIAEIEKGSANQRMRLRPGFQPGSRSAETDSR